VTISQADVKLARQFAIQTGPRAYERWRASRLGSVTETLEQTRILDLIDGFDR
jgi:hypothetical protein